MILVLALAGCSGDDNERFSSLDTPSGGNAPVLDTENYGALMDLMGNPTQGELIEATGGMFNKLSTLAYEYDQSGEDWQAVWNITTNLHGLLVEYQNSAGDAGAEEEIVVNYEEVDNVLDGAGRFWNSLIEQVGPDCIQTDIYPLVEYLMLADEKILQDVIDGINVGDLTVSTEEMDRVWSPDGTSGAMEHFMDLSDDGRYHELYAAIDNLIMTCLSAEVTGHLTVGRTLELLEDSWNWFKDSRLKDKLFAAILDESAPDQQEVTDTGTELANQEEEADGEGYATQDFASWVDEQKAKTRVTKAFGRLLLELMDPHTIGYLREDLAPFKAYLKQVGDEMAIDRAAVKTLVDYLLDDVPGPDGTTVDNPFVIRLKTLFFEISDLQDATYNPEGTITREQPLFTWVRHVIGYNLNADGSYESVGLYDVTFVKDFLTSDFMIPLGQFLEKGMRFALVDNTGEGSAAMKLVGRLLDGNMVSVGYVQAMFRPADFDKDGTMDDAFVKDIFGLLKPAETNMREFFIEIRKVVTEVEIDPRSDFINLLVELLGLIAGANS